MAERSYDVDRVFVQMSGSTEAVVLTADVDGETLVVERMGILSAIGSAANSFALRKYVSGTLAFEWRVALAGNGATTPIKGPWVLIGSSSAIQELRVQRLTGTGSDQLTAYFSRE